MEEKISFWDQVYEINDNIWGASADAMLREYHHIIPKGNVMDLGTGEGRNALFFAKMGYNVEANDVSPKAIDRCLENANRAGLENCSFTVADLKNIELEPEKYSLIICSSVLQFFTLPERLKIVSEIKKGLAKGGFVYLNAFTTGDSSYKMYLEAEIEMPEEATFLFTENDQVIHYFTRDEVETLFEELQHVAISDGKYLDESHGGHTGLCHYLGRKYK